MIAKQIIEKIGEKFGGKDSHLKYEKPLEDFDLIDLEEMDTELGEPLKKCAKFSKKNDFFAAPLPPSLPHPLNNVEMFKLGIPA